MNMLIMYFIHYDQGDEDEDEEKEIQVFLKI